MKHKKQTSLFSIGKWISFSYLVLFSLLILTGYKYEFIVFRPTELNQIGDFLAGLFGPLAILWLVLGFLQQGAELKNSAEALRLQKEELQNSVAAIQSQTRVHIEALTQTLNERKDKELEALMSIGNAAKLAINLDGSHSNEIHVRLTMITNKPPATIAHLEVHFAQLLENINTTHLSKGESGFFRILIPTEEQAANPKIILRYERDVRKDHLNPEFRNRAEPIIHLDEQIFELTLLDSKIPEFKTVSYTLDY